MERPNDMTDLFNFINKIDADKNELHVELFMFNKNYTPYAVHISNDIQMEMKKIFLFDVINDVQLGAGTGLKVMDYEKATTKDVQVVYETPLEKVGRANTLIHIIENDRDDIVYFNQEEHEFKRMQGFIARYTHPTDKKLSFYIFKTIKPTDSISTDTAWQFDNDGFDLMQPQVALKPSTDKEVLAVDKSIFIFQKKKFEKLFKYDFVKIQAADKKAEDLLKKFKISVPADLEGDIKNILRESTALMDKFLKVDIDIMDQAKVIEIADNMQLELMTDDEGAIIIMDKKDLTTFLDIVNDDYLESETGNHYLAKSKKPVELAGE